MRLHPTEVTRQGQKLQLALKFAQTSDRTKSDFLATVNHEFRSSVNIIIGYCELSNVNSQGHRDPNIESIHAEAEKLLLMLDDILDVSKSNADTMSITMAPVNFKELAREMQRIFGRPSNGKFIPLEVKVAPKTPVIFSDYKALRQILMRLLSQVYSIADHDAVTLAIQPRDRNIVIDISLNSRTIQVKQDKSLSIFKRLCERLRGTLNVKQTQTGLVLEVVLNNPDICDTATTSDLPDLTVQKNKPRKDVVLLVDDIAVNLKVLATMLEKLNVKSVPCATATAAMEEIAQYTPLAVFTDLWMPDIGGEELATVLRDNPQTASIPRILITADTQMDKKIEDLFLRVVYKPLKPKELKQVWSVIQQHNSEQEAKQA